MTSHIADNVPCPRPVEKLAAHQPVRRCGIIAIGAVRKGLAMVKDDHNKRLSSIHK